LLVAPPIESARSQPIIADNIAPHHHENGFAGHRGPNRTMTTRQYARLVSEWIGSVGLDPRLFGTHSLRRTKATLIYRRTGNLRAVQLLLGHTNIESTVRYLGIEVDDALAITEQVDV
jgi:integrase